MKIGIMLRHYDQHGGGVKVYTQSLLREMFALETAHEFVLLYQNSRLVGAFAGSRNVRETFMRVPSPLLWDQLAVTWMERTEKFDVLFNPKYSLPLAPRCRMVFVCHGLDWYVMPWGSKWLDRLSHKFLIPRYSRKADAVIAVSESVRRHVVEYLRVEESRVHMVPHGVDDEFREPISKDTLDKTRRIYGLPDRFFLYVGQIYPPKNFGRLLHAYAQVGPKLGIHLVLSAEHRWLCDAELRLIDQLGISDWVVQPGWVGRSALHAFYALAEALLLPSLYEGFGLPVLEAMASG